MCTYIFRVELRKRLIYFRPRAADNIFPYWGTKISFQPRDTRNSVNETRGERGKHLLRPEAKLRKRRYTGYHAFA